MKIFSPSFLIKLHLHSAAFILPIALMFLSTGFLIFVLDMEGGYYRTPYSIKLDQPLTQDHAKLKRIVVREMGKIGLTKPQGKTRIEQLDSEPGYLFVMKDSIKKIINLVPTADPLVAELTIKEASLYRKFVLLHKAKGNRYFRLYASIFALILLSMLITGYFLAWRVKRHRKPLMLSSTASILLFIGMLFIQ